MAHNILALMSHLAGLCFRLQITDHVFVVGGAVRNHLIGEEIKDIDLVVDSLALGQDSLWLAQSFARLIGPVDITVNQYGVAIMSIKSGLFQGQVVEIANARTESYSVDAAGKGYKPSHVAEATIHEDMCRRDFTVNTLMWRLPDLVDGPDNAQVIDLLSVGVSDLNARVLRTPFDPNKTFSDDPTRMLRAIKFLMRYNMTLSPETEDAIRGNAHRLMDMPHEAVSKILVKDILNPFQQAALPILKSLGLVPVLRKMFTEIRSFASFVETSFAGKDPILLLDLADCGLGDKAVAFLSADQRVRLRELLDSRSVEDRLDFFAQLRQPALDNMALIERFNIPANKRGVLARLAREALLADPSNNDLTQTVASSLEGVTF